MDARNFDAVWNLVLQLQLFDSLQNYECHRRSLPSFDVSHRKWWEERSTYQKQAVCRFETTKNLLRSEWVSGRDSQLLSRKLLKDVLLECSITLSCFMM